MASLRQRILDLRLEPGTSLAENELSAELGVSRTPVREALILLVREGLVETYPQVGTFVSRIDPAAVAEAQFIRESLEITSLREWAPHAEEAQIKELRGILERQRFAVKEGEVDQFFELDELLHHTLMRLAGHSSAWDVVASAKAHLHRARLVCLPVADTLDRMLAQHTDIVDKLATGNADQAEHALRTHLREVFHDIDIVKSTSPHYFTNGQSRPTRRAHLV